MNTKKSAHLLSRLDLVQAVHRLLEVGLGLRGLLRGVGPGVGGRLLRELVGLLGRDELDGLAVAQCLARGGLGGLGGVDLDLAGCGTDGLFFFWKWNRKMKKKRGKR